MKIKQIIEANAKHHGFTAGDVDAINTVAALKFRAGLSPADAVREAIAERVARPTDKADLPMRR